MESYQNKIENPISINQILKAKNKKNKLKKTIRFNKE
jgi:hypothetical protein